MKAAFVTVPQEAALRPAELVDREWLTDGYVRVRVAGESLVGFDPPGADDHVRLFFPPPGAAGPTTPEEWREFPSREYTPLRTHPVAGLAEFDFLIHGSGPGSAWAAQAPVGAAVAVAGPRRSNAVTGEPDALFLAGDETAVPAISRFLSSRPAGTPARVIVEVAAENELVPVPVDDKVELTVLVRPSQTLAGTLAALSASDRPDGDVLAFVAAEAGIVPIARDLLLDRWGLSPEAVITKGYWRRD